MQALPRISTGQSIRSLSDVTAFIEEAAESTTAMVVKIGNKRSITRKSAALGVGQKLSLVSGGKVNVPLLPSR